MPGRSVHPFGDETQVRALYHAHSGELFGFALHALGDERLAEEAVQETFLRAWRSGNRFDAEIASARTWLFAIIRNVIVDQLRTRRANVLALDSNHESLVDADEPVERALTSWQVEEALRRISDDHRRVLIETHILGRPYAEVASALGVPEGTVKSRVYYALRALRLALEEMGWEG